MPSQGGVTIEALDIPSVVDVNLPAWLFRPEVESSSNPVVLMLHPAGRNAAWHEGELCIQLALSGLTTCAVDVRGIGDLSPEFSPGAPAHARSHQTEEDYAWSSLILGRPLLGQRVTDILAATQALRTDSTLRGRRIIIAAFGTMTVPALFAAALEPEVHRLYLAGGLLSYHNIVETEEFRHTFADFVPNLLAHTDLPELVAGLAPMRVLIAGPVDAKGATSSIADVRNAYAAALRHGHLSLLQQADWNVKAIREFCS